MSSDNCNKEAWICKRCRQTNSAFSNECGRCEARRDDSLSANNHTDSTQESVPPTTDLERDVIDFIRNDAYAMTFQTMGQYRKAMAAHISIMFGSARRASEPREHIPKELFDGYAVWVKVGCVTRDNVKRVLDAVVKLIRERLASEPGKALTKDEGIALLRRYHIAMCDYECCGDSFADEATAARNACLKAMGADSERTTSETGGGNE